MYVYINIWACLKIGYPKTPQVYQRFLIKRGIHHFRDKPVSKKSWKRLQLQVSSSTVCTVLRSMNL